MDERLRVIIVGQRRRGLPEKRENLGAGQLEWSAGRASQFLAGRVISSLAAAQIPGDRLQGNSLLLDARRLGVRVRLDRGAGPAEDGDPVDD